MRWIILAVGLVLIALSGYIFYRKFEASKQALKDMMNDPALRDRTLEISLFGGMASMKVGHKDQPLQLVDVTDGQGILQLEEKPRSQVDELSRLAKLLDDDLITKDEFQQMKQKIVQEPITLN